MSKELLKKVLIGLGIALLLLVVTVGAVFVVVPRVVARINNPEPAAASQSTEIIMEEWEFLTNLSDLRFIQLKFRIVVPSDKVAGEIRAREAELRSDILAFLNGKSTADVSGEQGVNLLKLGLLQRINAHLVQGKALKVYLTFFAIQ
ncbi:MAG: flagellar basal body-associated FliL family protein [Bacillota bacterium]